MGSTVSTDFAYGRANRPQTPINTIIANNYGEKASDDLQTKYKVWKQLRNTSKGLTDIRMTNAQMKADTFTKQKVQAPLEEPKAEFKLKRFQNVEPRTDTKRLVNAGNSVLNQ